MENNNAENTKPTLIKSRRTYLLAGIPCLCWEGGLYAPLSGESANLGQVLVSPDPEGGAAVTVKGLAGEETWLLESRASIKARGAKVRKVQPRILPE